MNNIVAISTIAQGPKVDFNLANRDFGSSSKSLILDTNFSSKSVLSKILNTLLNPYLPFI